MVAARALRPLPRSGILDHQNGGSALAARKKRAIVPGIGIHLIGGSGSAGTTLLAHLLDGLHDIRSGPEAGLFHHRGLYGHDETEAFRVALYTCLTEQAPAPGIAVKNLHVPLVPQVFFMERDWYGAPTAVDELALLDSSAGLADFLTRVKTAMGATQEIEGDFTWIDHTPRNVVGAPDFVTYVPGGKIIHMIRDGRDVVLSLALRYRNEAPGHDMETYVSAGAVRWTWDTRQGLRARGLPGYLEVRYEELVADPVTQLNRILEHIEKPPITQEQLDSHRSPTADKDAHRFKGGDKPTWGAQPTGPISTASVGRWRKHLDDRALADLYRIRFEIQEDATAYWFGELMEELGYK